MIKEQSRFTINPLYVVAVALCCICSVSTTLFNGLLFGLATAVIALICINLISLTEKIANKNLRAFLIAIMAGFLIVICECAVDVINIDFFTLNKDNLKWVVISVITLSIVPTYFETRLATRHYFGNMLYSIFAFVVLTIVYATILEFCTLGSVAGYQIFKSFSGFALANQLFFQLFVIAILLIVSNLIYQHIEDRRLKSSILVERYKLQIKKVINNSQEEDEND